MDTATLPRSTPDVESLAVGEKVVLRNAYHETTTNVTVNKNGVIAARTYRRACRELCEAEEHRDACGCNGPHTDPDIALVPLGSPTSCEWQVCRRPPRHRPSRVGKAARTTAAFTFLTVVPYVIVHSWFYLGKLLSLSLGVCVLGVKAGFYAAIIGFGVYCACLASAMF